jgi:hypothetical protein
LKKSTKIKKKARSSVKERSEKMTTEDLLEIERPKIEQLKSAQDKFNRSGQLELFKEFSEQLKADGITYSIYDEYKENYNRLMRETGIIYEHLNSKQLKAYIREREELYYKSRNPSNYLDKFDAIIAQGNLDKSLKELKINKAYWDSQLKTQPDNAVLFEDSKADDMETSALMRLNDNLTPMKLVMQEYQKTYKINTDKFNSDVALAFQRAREISDNSTPDEYKNVLNQEDKMISTVAEMNNIIAFSKHRFYLAVVAFRTIAKDVQTFKKERLEEKAKTEAEKKKTKDQQAKTKISEENEKAIKARIERLTDDERQLKERIDNLLELAKVGIAQNTERKKDDVGGGQNNPETQKGSGNEKDSKNSQAIKSMAADERLIIRKQSEGYIYLPHRHLFVMIGIRKSNAKHLKNPKKMHTVLDSIGRPSGTMHDKEFQSEYAQWKVKRDDAKRNKS